MLSGGLKRFRNLMPNEARRRGYGSSDPRLRKATSRRDRPDGRSARGTRFDRGLPDDFRLQRRTRLSGNDRSEQEERLTSEIAGDGRQARHDPARTNRTACWPPRSAGYRSTKCCLGFRHGPGGLAPGEEDSGSSSHPAKVGASMNNQRMEPSRVPYFGGDLDRR